MLTVRLGGMVLPYGELLGTVTVPMYVPLHWAAFMVWHIAVRVSPSYDGPQVAWLVGATVSLILVLLTLVERTTLVTGGAHLKKSVVLPELLPVVAVNFIVTGLLDQITFEPVELANPTAT